MGNIFHLTGKELLNEQIREVIHADKDSLEAFERFQDHLAANGVRLKKTPAVFGPWLKMDSSKERFFERFSNRANKLLMRDYRKPCIVPQQVWWTYQLWYRKKQVLIHLLIRPYICLVYLQLTRSCILLFPNFFSFFSYNWPHATVVSPPFFIVPHETFTSAHDGS